MLYFGSFNPVHKGHIALAEYIIEHDLADETVLIVSPQSPYKTATALAPEIDRFQMAEIACAASKYPERIKPSAIEFMLPRPSYTIDTLHYLEETCGHEMRFSILMGSDQIAALDGCSFVRQLLFLIFSITSLLTLPIYSPSSWHLKSSNSISLRSSSSYGHITSSSVISLMKYW